MVASYLQTIKTMILSQVNRPYTEMLAKLVTLAQVQVEENKCLMIFGVMV